MNMNKYEYESLGIKSRGRVFITYKSCLVLFKQIPCDHVEIVLQMSLSFPRLPCSDYENESTLTAQPGGPLSNKQNGKKASETSDSSDNGTNNTNNKNQRLSGKSRRSVIARD